MTIRARLGARPTLLAVTIAVVVGGYIATRPNTTTVIFPAVTDATVVDAPADSPIDSPPIDSPAVTTWTMRTIHGPESTVSLDGADGVDVATIGGAMTVVSPWEQSSKVTVSTRSIGVGVGTWSTIELATVTNVEDAKWCDVDGDGNLDVVAGGQGKRIRVWFGPTPYTTNFDIGAATNLQMWMQLACTSPTSKTFTADAGTDTITATTHGWSTTDLVRLTNSGGALPTGLSTATDYYVIRTAANTFKLATSRVNASAETAIDITANGTGTHTAAGGMRIWAGGRLTTNITFTAAASTDLLTKVAHGFSTGDFVQVSNSGGVLPTGLVASTTYYTIRISADTYKLATSQANAFSGTAIDLTTDGTGTQTAVRQAVVAYFQSGDPRTSSAYSYMPVAINGWLMSLLSDDYDGDGDLDVIISERQAGCCAGTKGSKWYRSDAAGVWTALTIYNFGSPSNQGDPKFLEVVGASTVMTGGSSATQPNKLVKSVTADSWATWTSTEITYPSNVGLYQGVATCDLTGDGTADYVLSHFSSTGSLDGLVYVDGSTLASTSIDLATGEKYDNVECLDMDGDGDLDVITTEQTAGLGVIWFQNPRL